MDAFKHEGQEVYQAALDLVAVLDRLTRTFSPNRATIGDGLNLAAVTVVREVAAGMGQPNTEDTQRHLRDALSGTLHIAGLLDVARILRATDEESYAQARTYALRIASVLTDSLADVR